MFFDENLTKTKAFKEQLEQHAELFANQPKLSPGFQAPLMTRVREALTHLPRRVKNLMRLKPNIYSSISMKESDEW